MAHSPELSRLKELLHAPYSIGGGLMLQYTDHHLELSGPHGTIQMNLGEVTGFFAHQAGIIQNIQDEALRLYSEQKTWNKSSPQWDNQNSSWRNSNDLNN